MYKILPVSFLLITLSGCGAANLKQSDYDLVSNGKMALLITDNPGLFDPIDILLFKEETSVSITRIDENKIDYEFLKNDQHVLVEPGKRIISVRCTVRKRDKEVRSVSKAGSMMHTVKAGNIYRIRPVSFANDYEPCTFELLSHNRLNLSKLGADMELEQEQPETDFD